jgi:hypothetical protein
MNARISTSFLLNNFPLGKFKSQHGIRTSSGILEQSMGLKFSFQANRTNVNHGFTSQAFAQYIYTNYKLSTKDLEGLDPNLNYSSSTGTWNMGGILIGMDKTIPWTDYFSFDFRALGGWTSVQTPWIFIKGTKPEYDIRFWRKQDPIRKNAFIYDLGASFNIEIRKKYALMLSADLTGTNLIKTKAKVNDIFRQTANPDWNFQPFMLNLSMGWGWNF